jgi:AraC family transcriptional activator of mar-sox-rob regulon
MFWSTRFRLKASTEWQSHEVFELLFCLSGRVRVEIGEDRLDVEPGRMILIAPAARHRLLASPTEPVEMKVVCLTAEDTVHYLSPAQSTQLTEIEQRGFASYGDGQASTTLPSALAEMVPEGEGVARPRDLLMVWSVISLLLAVQMPVETLAVDDELSQHGRVRTICSWLDAHLDQETSLDALAAEFGLSRSLLTRIFRRHAGTSVVHYVNARRLEKAAALLTGARPASITDAALESGFANLSHFHRRFKAAFGMTPAEFRRLFAMGREGHGQA